MADYTLPPLPYDYGALEPHIDAKTMEIHHGKHHQAYVTNLNAALKDHPDHQGKPIEQLIADLERPARRDPDRRAEQRRRPRQPLALLADHEAASGGGEPTGALAQAITSDLGGFAAFKEAFAKAATTRFGSGWAWLVVGKDGKLAVTSTPNQDSPLMDGSDTPLLGLDVWEHAYYLNYQNRRPDYITAWWNTVNWDEVGRRYDAAKGCRSRSPAGRGVRGRVSGLAGSVPARLPTRPRPGIA